MPAKKKTEEKAEAKIEKEIPKKAPVKKVVLRNVVPGDHKGSVDFDLLDDKGMKVLQIRNANRGLIVRFFDEENKVEERFCPVGALVDFLMSQPA